MKNQFTVKILPGPTSIRGAASKNYVDNKIIDPRIIENTAHVDLNDKNLDNVRFDKVNSLPAVREHPAPKFFFDEVIPYSIK